MVTILQIVLQIVNLQIIKLFYLGYYSSLKYV